MRGVGALMPAGPWGVSSPARPPPPGRRARLPLPQASGDSLRGRAPPGLPGHRGRHEPCRRSATDVAGLWTFGRDVSFQIKNEIKFQIIPIAVVFQRDNQALKQGRLYSLPRKPKVEGVAAFVKVTEASRPGVSVSRVARGVGRARCHRAFPARRAWRLPLPEGTPVPWEQPPTFIYPRCFLRSLSPWTVSRG